MKVFRSVPKHLKIVQYIGSGNNLISACDKDDVLDSMANTIEQVSKNLKGAFTEDQLALVNYDTSYVSHKDELYVSTQYDIVEIK